MGSIVESVVDRTECGGGAERKGTSSRSGECESSGRRESGGIPDERDKAILCEPECAAGAAEELRECAAGVGGVSVDAARGGDVRGFGAGEAVVVHQKVIYRRGTRFIPTGSAYPRGTKEVGKAAPAR